jgi:hypothetical protein
VPVDPLVGVDRLVGVAAAVSVDLARREARAIDEHLCREHVGRFLLRNGRGCKRGRNENGEDTTAHAAVGARPVP